MKDHELLFKIECEKFLPLYIRSNSQNYKLYVSLLGGDWKHFEYVRFDGDEYDFSNDILTLEYDGTWTIDTAIADYMIELKRLDYTILNEIVSKDTLFKRELTQLINKYSKDNDSNTPDYILAEYLINCLNAFTIAKNTIDERNARG